MKKNHALHLLEQLVAEKGEQRHHKALKCLRVKIKKYKQNSNYTDPYLYLDEL